MFDANIAGDKKNGTLTLRGDLGVNNMERIKDALLEVISRFKKITVKIEDLEHVDFTCFQLFCAAHKSCAAQKKSLEVTAPADGSFYEILEYAGFAYTENNRYQARGFVLKEAV